LTVAVCLESEGFWVVSYGGLTGCGFTQRQLAAKPEKLNRVNPPLTSGFVGEAHGAYFITH